jgi:hypothetical protein
MEGKIRVFISYSHSNKEFVGKLIPVLEKCDIDVIWDNNLIAGSGFHDQIKDSIASAHIFLPLITKESSERGWVHQEIGYAMALNIPVLPITTEDLDPGGMLQFIHAVKIDKAENPEKFLNRFTFQSLLNNSNTTPLFQCAHLPEERTRMLIEYANKIAGIDRYGMVRQKGGLSSFHIPDECILKTVWNERYIPEVKSEYHKRLQRNERLALEKHAIHGGYKIIITPEYAIKGRSKVAAGARINTLINFLEKYKPEMGVVAIQNEEKKNQSLTIVGDWFLAESVSFNQGDGFTNTFFTRDAAEIARRTEDFECELQDLLDQWGWSPEDSREKAIKELRRLHDKLENHAPEEQINLKNYNT